MKTEGDGGFYSTFMVCSISLVVVLALPLHCASHGRGGVSCPSPVGTTTTGNPSCWGRNEAEVYNP